MYAANGNQLTTAKKTTLKFPLKKDQILINFILFVKIISPQAEANQPTNHAGQASQGNCTYSIQIETTCAPSAETTDHKSVRFNDSAGDFIIIKHLKNSKLLYGPKEKNGGFQRCSRSSFEARGACMKQSVSALYLKRVESDEWRPGWAKILHQEESRRPVPVSYTSHFRTFVPENVWYGYGFDYCHSNTGFVPHVATFGEEN